MILLISLLLIILYVRSPFFAYCFWHPILFIKWFFNDIYDYFSKKRYNECKFYGTINVFTAYNNMAFGCGKTLSAVKRCNDLDKQFNGKMVWSDDKKDFVVQHLFFCSNIELKDVTHYIPFRSKDQFVNIEDFNLEPQDILIFVLDECGIVFNSRDFKSNISSDFLQNLLQVRHNKVAFILTAQRFNMIDKVLRECTSTVIACEKNLRLFCQRFYNAYELENADNPMLIEPVGHRVFLATDKLYKSYDTNYNIGKLKERLEDHDFMDTRTLLADRGDTGDINHVSKFRKKYKKRFQK